ncbi:MAG: nucleotide pyrophosphohydrolase [Candidatus Odinarchaeia archaeon]
MALTIEEAQQRVDEFISKYEVGYWEPLALLAGIMEETGELSREIMALTGIKPAKEKERLKGFIQELGDLFFNIICLANKYGIDLEKALLSTIEKYNKRDNGRWKRKVEKQ